MKQAHIKNLRAKGFTLIPLNGKIPAVKNWQKAGPSDYPNAGNNGGNYGVALHAGDLVIDVDPRAFTPGDKPLSRLISAIGPLNSTFTVKTGGGGLHIYLSKPADITIAHTLPDYPGLEFKSNGRQVVGPGSIHPETKKEYAVVSKDGAEIEKAPLPLLELLKITAVPYAEIEKGKKCDEYKNDANTQKRFVDYLCTVAPISVEGKQGDATAFAVACSGRDYGLPPANTSELMAEYWNPRCLPPWEDAELETKIIHAYKYAKGEIGNRHPGADFAPVDKTVAEVRGGGKDNGEKGKSEEIVWQLTKNRQVVKCFYNLLNFLRLPGGGLKGVFGYNAFTGQVEFIAPAPWHKGKMPNYLAVTDHDLKLLKAHLAIKHGFEQTIGGIEEAVTVTGHDNKFHPVREYLNAQKWDGKRRLDTWLTDYGHVADSGYTRAVARKVLCAAVARILKPGCKFDHIMVLEGEQGIGKSRLCAILGGEWSADFTIDPHNKDTVQSLQGKWIIEMAEMAVVNRAEQQALKAFITRQSDKARLAYGRLSMEFPRQCIFIGTINPEADGTYLKDSTGNRRFWPVALTGRVDFKGLAEARDQIFAEAVALVKSKGEKLFMDDLGLEEEARIVADARHADDPWTERIGAWLHDNGPVGAGTGKGREFITARDIFIDAMGGIDKQLGRRDLVSIANVMRKMGWKAIVKRQGDRLVRGYVKAGAASDGSGDELEGLI